MTDLRVTAELARKHIDSARQAYLAAWCRVRSLKDNGRPAPEIEEAVKDMLAAEKAWEASERLLAEMEGGTH